MPPTPWTRDTYLARVSDLLRRSSVDDAEELVRLLEANVPPVLKLDKFDDVRDLVRAGRKIEAIKRYRELTNAGLKEAKDAVEAPDFLTPLPAAPQQHPDEDPRMEEVRSLARASRKIDAIKLHREITGLGLKESKDAVEKM